MTVPTPHAETPDGHVVRGAPDEAELAALVAGLVASGTHHEPTSAASAWAEHRRALPTRPPAEPGPDSWRWSLHP